MQYSPELGGLVMSFLNKYFSLKKIYLEKTLEIHVRRIYLSSAHLNPKDKLKKEEVAKQKETDTEAKRVCVGA